jgi:NitT/TauT family transport system substrate-binding protein
MKSSVRLAWIPGATFAGDYAALNNGYWKDAGIDVQIKPGGFEFDAIKLVASGTDTFGIASGPQILNARASGIPVVAIGAVIPQSPIGWIAKADSGIKTPRQFVGKRIGAQFGTHTEITFEALMAKLGISLKSLQRIPVKFDPKPFITGDVDVLPVYLIDQPVDLEAVGMKLNQIDPGDYGVALAYGNLYFTTKETLSKDPELVRRFLNGARRGWLWVDEHPAEAVDVLLKHMPGSQRENVAEKLSRTLAFIKKGRAEYPGIYEMDVSSWERTANIMRQFSELRLAEPVSNSFTNQYLVPTK